jgi:hypothetical protein
MGHFRSCQRGDGAGSPRKPLSLPRQHAPAAHADRWPLRALPLCWGDVGTVTHPFSCLSCHAAFRHAAYQDPACPPDPRRTTRCTPKAWVLSSVRLIPCGKCEPAGRRAAG